MVDWSKAPDGAEYYGRAADWNFDTYFMFIGEALYWFKGEQWVLFSSDKAYDKSVQQVRCMQKRPDGIAPDWSKAPDVATHYGTIVITTGFWEVSAEKIWYLDSEYGKLEYVVFGDRHRALADLTPRPNRVILDGIAQSQPTTNKYDRTIHGKYGTGQCTVDVYRVLNAFGPLSPEIDHAVKKLLAPGGRGHKDEKQDLLEAIQSIEARLQYLEAVNG